MISWFAKNDVAANLLMVAIALLGLYMVLKNTEVNPLKVAQESMWKPKTVMMRAYY